MKIAEKIFLWCVVCCGCGVNRKVDAHGTELLVTTDDDERTFRLCAKKREEYFFMYLLLALP